MNLDVNELDMLPAIEETNGGPSLTTACCTNCPTSQITQLLSHGC